MNREGAAAYRRGPRIVRGPRGAGACRVRLPEFPAGVDAGGDPGARGLPAAGGAWRGGAWRGGGGETGRGDMARTGGLDHLADGPRDRGTITGGAERVGGDIGLTQRPRIGGDSRVGEIAVGGAGRPTSEPVGRRSGAMRPRRGGTIT